MVDRDEARFAQASRQMFESAALPEPERDFRHAGGLVVPMVGDRPRLNKPPLIYWLQSASAAAWTGGDPGRDALWMYRLPSPLCSALAVLITWRLGRRMFDARAAWFGAAMLALCPMVVWDAHQARSDQLLLATAALTQYGLWRVWSAARRGRADLAGAACVWIGFAAGVLAKGPITPLVFACTTLGLCAATRSWRWLGRLRFGAGLLLTTALVGAWVAGVVRHVGWDVYSHTIYQEVIGRSMDPKEGHWGPPGYHTFLLAALFWPGSLATAWAIGSAVRRRIGRRRAPGRGGELFCLAWIIPAWIVFEIISTKLPHYTLPMYPAVALLTARGLMVFAHRVRHAHRPWTDRAGEAIWLTLGAGLVVAAPLALTLIAHRSGGPIPGPAVFVLAGCAAGTLLAAGLMLARSRPIAAQGAGMVAAVIGLVNVLGVVLPGDRPWWVTSRLERALAAVGVDMSNPGAKEIGAAGYAEDSLGYATRGRIIRLPESDAIRWLDADARRVLIAPTSLAEAHRAGGGSAPQIGRVRGLNYSNGTAPDLTLLTGPTPPPRADPARHTPNRTTTR